MKFQFIVLKKQKINVPDTEVAVFPFMTQNYLNIDDQVKILKDNASNRIQIKIKSQRSYSNQEDRSDSSVQKQASIKKLKWQKKQKANILNQYSNKKLPYIPIPPSKNNQNLEVKSSIVDILKQQTSISKLSQMSTPTKQRIKIFDNSRKKSKSPSFKAVFEQQIKQKNEDRQKEQRRIFNKSFKKRQEGGKGKIIKMGQELQTPIKQNLYEVQQKLKNSRMHNQSIFSQLKQQNNKELTQSKLVCQQLKKMNSKFNFQINDLMKQNKQLTQKNSQLSKKYLKIVRQNRQIKQQKQQLQNQNTYLLAINDNKNTSHNLKNSILNQSLTLSKMFNINDSQNKRLIQFEDLKKQRNRYLKQCEDIKQQKQILQAKYNQILLKYNKLINDLKIQELYEQQQAKLREALQKKIQQNMHAKDEQILNLQRQVRYLQFKLMNPEDELNQKQHNQLKDRLQKLLIDLNQQQKQNHQIQQLLRRQLNNKKQQYIQIQEKYNLLQKKKHEEMQLWQVKEKSLSKAMEVKDKKIAQLLKQTQIHKSKASEANTFIQSEKAQILVKIEYLTQQLQRRKSCEQQLIGTQLRLKECSIKNKAINDQNLELKIQIQRFRQKLRSKALEQKTVIEQKKLIKQYENELVKTKMKVAEIIQVIFQKDPQLAQIILQIK